MNHTINNRVIGKKLSKIEKELLDNGLLRLSFLKKEKLTEKTLKDFIIKFIRVYNNEKNTYTLKGNLQCSNQCRRSGGDIFRICKYYFPKTKFIDVMRILESLPNETVGVRSSVCHTISKRVYYSFGDDTHITRIANEDTLDEFGMNIYRKNYKNYK